jgi:hypothetical protein
LRTSELKIIDQNAHFDLVSAEKSHYASERNFFEREEAQKGETAGLNSVYEGSVQQYIKIASDEAYGY